ARDRPRRQRGGGDPRRRQSRDGRRGPLPGRPREGEVMGSATTQALAASTNALAAASGVTLDTARELFAAARAVGESSQLSGALADPAAPAAARQNVVTAVFGSFSATTVSVLKV